MKSPAAAILSLMTRLLQRMHDGIMFTYPHWSSGVKIYQDLIADRGC